MTRVWEQPNRKKENILLSSHRFENPLPSPFMGKYGAKISKGGKNSRWERLTSSCRLNFKLTYYKKLITEYIFLIIKILNLNINLTIKFIIFLLKFKCKLRQHSAYCNVYGHSTCFCVHTMFTNVMFTCITISSIFSFEETNFEPHFINWCRLFNMLFLDLQILIETYIVLPFLKKHT